MTHLGTLLGRFGLAFIFLVSGVGKLGAGYAGTQQYMDPMGVPGALLPLVILAELAGGLAIAAGLLTRWAALGLAAFALLSGVLFHYQPQDPMQMIGFMKNIAIAGGLLVLAAHGAGRFSVDAWWAGRDRAGGAR